MNRAQGNVSADPWKIDPAVYTRYNSFATPYRAAIARSNCKGLQNHLDPYASVVMCSETLAISQGV